jgi:hypothetical protein
VREIKIANRKVSPVPWPALTSLGFSRLLISRAQPFFLSFVTDSGVQAYTSVFLKLWSLILKTDKTCNKRLKRQFCDHSGSRATRLQKFESRL